MGCKWVLNVFFEFCAFNKTKQNAFHNLVQCRKLTGYIGFKFCCVFAETIGADGAFHSLKTRKLDFVDF